MIDYRLYFVTDPILCMDRGLVETTLAAVRGGASLVQYRNPNAKGRHLFEEALALRQALKPLGVPFIVNDRVDIALAVGADGVHVGQSDLSAAKARELMGPEALVGLSIDTPCQIGPQEEAVCDHFGVGPVFSTHTKSDALPAIGLHGLAEICTRSKRPVVAIGGIGEQHVSDIRRAGADGIAVVSAIASAQNPEAAARNLLAAWMASSNET